jgi:tyrosinase
LKDKCGFKGTQPYWDWTKNHDDFNNSKIFSPSVTTGFGGNGDPNKDYEVYNCAFSTDFILAYPVPHPVRRSFTLRPWFDALPPAADPTKLALTAITKAEVQKLVNGFKGDFDAFQQSFAAYQVRAVFHASLFLHLTIVLLQGAHSAVHFYVNAFVTFH